MTGADGTAAAGPATNVEWRLRRPNENALVFAADEEEYVEGPEVDSAGTFTLITSIHGRADEQTDEHIYGIGWDGEIGIRVKHRSESTGDFTLLASDADNDEYVSFTSEFDPLDGDPHHLAAVVDRDEQTVVLYADGTEVHREEYDEPLFDEPRAVVDGAWSSGYGHFDGLIARSGIYHRALTEAEIEAWTNGVPPDGATALWEYDDADGATARDGSGNENHGTLHGPTWFDGDNPFAVDDDLLDVEVTDTFNRFARQARVVLDDPDGTKPGLYARPTPVDLEVRWGDREEFQRRFGGFVVKPESVENRTELEVLSHDFWLRKRQVFRSYEDEPILDVLEDLIVNLTPLDWIPGEEGEGNVQVVQNDQTVDRNWRGERLDEVIADLAAKSDYEEFGANDAGEFFFRPRNRGSAPRDFEAGEYVEADFEEDGKQEVNQVTIYYGEGEDAGAVAVEDRESQNDLANELGRERPVVVGVTKSFPEIGSEEAARDKARRILNDRAVVQTGSLITWEAFGIHPGDLAVVEVSEQGIDQEFRVAEITYRWADDETEIQLAEHRDDVVDTLVDMSNEISRLDARAANPGETVTRIFDVDRPFEIEVDVEVYSWEFPDDQFLFGQLKGGWGPRDTENSGMWGDHREERERIA